jgi:Uma2 family endonuclease
MVSGSSIEDRVRWDQFVALGEEDRRELVDGQLVEVEVPTERHEWVVAFLLSSLVQWSRIHGGRPLASGYKVRIDDRRGVMPDVQFYCKGRSPNPPQGLESGAPDLVVEVVSPASVRYDRVTKLNWYLSIQVPEYWLVDPEARTVERLVLEGSNYRIAASLALDGRFEPDSFPGLSIDLAELFTLPE